MARTELLATVNKVVGGNLQPASGVSVLVQARGTGTTVPVYASETGGTTVTNPLVTDADCRINGWIDSGSYNLTISGTGITTYTQPYESVRGDGVDLVAAGVVNTAQLVNSSVTYAKLAADVISNLIPPGTVWLTAAAVAPPGWVFCNGTLYNGTLATYTPLWNAIGTTHGGSGQASFAVPDMRGRVAVGTDLGSGRGRIYNLGDTGGLETNSLTVSQLPPHSHVQQGTFDTTTSGFHSHHIVVTAFEGAGNNSVNSGGTSGNGDAGPIEGAGDHIHQLTIGGRTANEGVGAAIENRQPFATLWYMIKL
jgi:microcystin-dependent protein